MLRVAESQQAMMPALTRLGDGRADEGAGQPELRAIERLLQRLLSESEQGRTQSTAELRNELRVLTRTVAAAGGQGGPSFHPSAAR